MHASAQADTEAEAVASSTADNRVVVGAHGLCAAVFLVDVDGRAVRLEGLGFYREEARSMLQQVSKGELTTVDVLVSSERVMCVGVATGTSHGLIAFLSIYLCGWTV